MSKDREWLVTLLTDIADTRQQWETSSGEPMHKDAKAALKYIEQLEKDADRYKFLRSQLWNDAELFVVAGGKGNVLLGTYCPSFERLDQEIDTALSHTK